MRGEFNAAFTGKDESWGGTADVPLSPEAERRFQVALARRRAQEGGLVLGYTALAEASHRPLADQMAVNAEVAAEFPTQSER